MYWSRVYWSRVYWYITYQLRILLNFQTTLHLWVPCCHDPTVMTTGRCGPRQQYDSQSFLEGLYV